MSTDVQFGNAVYVNAPNSSFVDKHGRTGIVTKIDDLIWVRMDKSGEAHTIEPEFVQRVRLMSEPATYMDEKVIIHQPVINAHEGTVGYHIRYPDPLRGTSYVEHTELSDWVEPVPSQDEIIADLTEQLYEASKEADRWKGWYQNDMQHWETVMREVKENRGWCDEGSNEVIRELNRGFQGWMLDYYEQEFDIEVTISANISTTTVVRVTAAGFDAANDLVIDNISDFVDTNELLAEEAKNGSYDVDVEPY